MPNRKTHEQYSLAYLNQYTPFLHSMLDAPAKTMKHTHRALFHDYRTVLLIESLFGQDLALEALLHIMVDLESVKPEHTRMIVLPIRTSPKWDREDRRYHASGGDSCTREI